MYVSVIVYFSLFFQMLPLLEKGNFSLLFGQREGTGRFLPKHNLSMFMLLMVQKSDDHQLIWEIYHYLPPGTPSVLFFLATLPLKPATRLP